MKKTFIVCIILFSIIFVANAQKIKITYNKSSDFAKEFIGLSDFDIKLILYYYNSGVSYCMKEEDDLSEAEDEFKMITQKDHRGKNVVTYMAFVDGDYLISDSWVTTWKLTNETQKILGYNCKKAVLDSTTVAWYAPSIPISDGPEQYCGLPGLILKVETPNGTYIAEEIDTNYKKEKKIIFPTDGKKITRKEFIDKMANWAIKQSGKNDEFKGKKVEIYVF